MSSRAKCDEFPDARFAEDKPVYRERGRTKVLMKDREEKKKCDWSADG